MIERLVADNFDLADIEFTRKLEEDLDAIAEARGKRARRPRAVPRALAEEDRAQPRGTRASGGPSRRRSTRSVRSAARTLKKRWGRNGPFIGCDGYPECKYTRALPGEGEDGDDGGDRRPQLTDYKCELCGSQMMKRWGRNGWFLGCSTFPKCKFTRSCRSACAARSAAAR